MPFTMATQFARVLRIMERNVWFFPVADGEPHFDDNGFSYFEEQAAEKAAMAGYELVTAKNVSIEGSRVSGWIIRGAVVLKARAAAAPKASALHAQMG
jgi:hypothetical protein